MKVSSSEPGVIVSAGTHVALLLATLVAFSETKALPDAQESVPVEILTSEQFNQIVKGDKQAKAPAPTPVKADRKSDIEEKKPTPRVEAKVDIPTPPPPLKRIPDPADDDAPQPVPTPPLRVASLPPEPPKSELPKPPTPIPPVRPTPPKVEAQPEPPKPKDAEAVEPPKPPVKPKLEPKKVEVTPEPPKKVRPVTPEPAPKVAEKPVEKPSLDKTALAKLLDAKKAEDKPAARPKSGEETSEPKTKFNSDAVSKILSSKEPPGQKPASSHEASKVASLGSPTANAPKMSPSMLAQLDSILLDQYKACWSYLNIGNSNGYVPRIRVEYSRDGTLVGQPQVTNPSGDPNVRGLADSAVRAVRRCNPLKIPPQFAPYFEQWKNRFVRFDPDELSG